MKKFVVLLAVVAMTFITAMAYAADVTVGGSLDIRSRDFSTLSLDKNDSSADQKDTQTRIRVDVNVKAGDVKGKVEYDTDWSTWGGSGKYENFVSEVNGPRFREAWINFNIPFLPINVTGGHQLLQLGNGWFFRSMKYGSDAWVIANQTGNNTAAFVDVKVAEANTFSADDVDAYVLLDVFKISDTATVGIDITDLRDRKGALGFGAAGFDTSLQNISLNFNGTLGPVALKAQLDQQLGKAKTAAVDHKFKGNEIVIQGNVPVDPVTINFTLARGSGDKAGDTDFKGYKAFLDQDPHYTFLYEYKLDTAAGAANAGGGIHTGFENTTAISVGASMAATKSLKVGVDAWYLRSTEKIASINGGTTNKLGKEVDLTLNWAVAENLNWNWKLGWFDPDDGMGKDAATGIQGVLSLKF